MTDTTVHEGYERITWPEVRAGDVLFHENGDRLTVDHVGPMYVGDMSGRLRTPYAWGDFGFLPYRKVEPLPTTPGAYLDKDGVVWELAGSGPWSWECGGDAKSTRKAAKHAPFTRLVPMPTEEDVLNAIGAPELMAHRTLTDDQVAAVIALLGGGDDE